MRLAITNQRGRQQYNNYLILYVSASQTVRTREGGSRETFLFIYFILSINANMDHAFYTARV